MADPKQATLSLKQIAAQIAADLDIAKKDAEAILASFVSSVVAQLLAGSKVRITGLGILSVRDRPARVGRNPQTGEQIQIKASKKVAFRVAKELKESI